MYRRARAPGRRGRRVSVNTPLIDRSSRARTSSAQRSAARLARSPWKAIRGRAILGHDDEPMISERLEGGWQKARFSAAQLRRRGAAGVQLVIGYLALPGQHRSADADQRQGVLDEDRERGAGPRGDDVE